ncbi:hypothetical protein PRBRB14_07120 [Hallella multisaccharivorax DSM 17128]|uniref:RNA polymerase, sigma-24 subunit, ECF subfamily n=1 Tax=Hallella multisaccharivorax DSM 17128 TaxID=688246 RepID=F8N722_9BACT|nr:sigma-70 family RNA polymerase sigma factor [Hallella multisaccharivorax]EGN56320.1 RNA polymerase, sigma-24 subunit, ECF subfamily [Hallella multisaccharivorax DSM 17128]GJG29833.1 hypothetical protein PRBRB14_07120 [Hallella multisaccharivorax DSM 17128]
MPALTETSFEKIFRQLYEPLYYYAYDILGDSDQSKDVVSDCFASVWQRHRDMEASTIKSYLYVCVRNRAIDLAKGKGMLQASPINDTLLNIDDDTEALIQEQIIALQHALEKLPPGNRKILAARYEQGMSIQKTAEAFAMSIDGVKKSVYRSLKTLRSLLRVKKE